MRLPAMFTPSIYPLDAEKIPFPLRDVFGSVGMTRLGGDRSPTQIVLRRRHRTHASMQPFAAWQLRRRLSIHDAAAWAELHRGPSPFNVREQHTSVERVLNNWRGIE